MVNEHSADWLAIQTLIRQRLTALHESLEILQPEANTNFIRGQIAELRDLIRAVVDPPPDTPKVDTRY